MTETIKNLTINTSGPELDAGLLNLKQKVVESFTDNVSAELQGKGSLQVQDAGYDVCGTWISLEVPIV